MNAKRMMLMVAATALAFAGCVPGTAKITAKASELDKAMAGGIGWVKVVQHQEQEFDNVMLTNTTQDVLHWFNLEGTNRVEHLFPRIFEIYGRVLPLYLQDDEKASWGYAVTNGKVRVWLDVELMAAVGRTNALDKARLPRLMQFDVADDGCVSCWDDLFAGGREEGHGVNREARKLFFSALPTYSLGDVLCSSDKKRKCAVGNVVIELAANLRALFDPWELNDLSVEMAPGEGHHRLTVSEKKYQYADAVVRIVPVK